MQKDAAAPLVAERPVWNSVLLQLPGERVRVRDEEEGGFVPTAPQLAHERGRHGLRSSDAAAPEEEAETHLVVSPQVSGSVGTERSERTGLHVRLATVDEREQGLDLAVLPLGA